MPAAPVRPELVNLADGALPQALVGVIAVGIPLLIVLFFFVFWDRGSGR